MHWLIEQLFMGWRHGRLARLPFACLTVGLVAATLLVQQGLWEALLVPPDMTPGGQPTTRLGWFMQRPMVGMYAIMGLALAVALFLTTIKRVRDMGLPALIAVFWMVVLVITEQVGGFIGSAADILNFLVLLSVLFTPSDWFEGDF